jgi:hypothetical protein
MKTLFSMVFALTALSSVAAFAGEPEALYYYNATGGAERMTISVMNDGSAEVRETCGGMSIEDWNIAGKPMKAEAFSGPVSTFHTELTITARESRENADVIRVRFSDGRGAVTFEKSDRPNTFMICL